MSCLKVASATYSMAITPLFMRNFWAKKPPRKTAPTTPKRFAVLPPIRNSVYQLCSWPISMSFWRLRLTTATYAKTFSGTPFVNGYAVSTKGLGPTSTAFARAIRGPTRN